MQDSKPNRTWQQIVEEASCEQDPQHLLELIDQPEAVLDDCAKPARGPD